MTDADRDWLSPAQHARALAEDLRALDQMRRRRVLLGLGAMSLLAGRSSSVLAASCPILPTETRGPYPADGTNRSPGVTSNALALAGIVRSDIRRSFAGGSSRQAAGASLDLTLTLVDAGAGCRPLAGHVLYLWHNDREGQYSLYDLPEESYLRGVQISNADGQLRFATIFPGCYPGRYPHLHFQIYRSRSAAQHGREALLTSQLAFPADACRQLYASPAYARSRAAFDALSFANDAIFRDNSPAQMTAMTLNMRGDARSGYLASAQIALAL
jgi:protocatechuate 3,4-dioxygenase beta subunit